jgi:Spy/CpxP family protein refolding chaperone
VLTPEQRVEYDRLRAEREARHRERSGHGGDGAPGGERT